jgi:hypothetical protein
MILTEHAGLTAAEIEIRAESFAASVAYAASIGAEVVIRSTTGLSGFVTAAEGVYSEIQCFVPLGSNSSIEISNPASVPVIVTCGAGDTDNDTAYGPGLEFWDRDADENPSDDASSYANGRICGKLLYIKDTKGWTWWQTRYAARMTASGGGTRTDANGYGQISVAAALAFEGTVPDDPYTATDEGNVEIKPASAAPGSEPPRLNVLKQWGRDLRNVRGRWC